jgi:hypothetical protein
LRPAALPSVAQTHSATLSTLKRTQGLEAQAAVDAGLASFGLLNRFQADRIRPAVERLPDPELLIIRGLQAARRSDPEGALVFKALSASHTVVEVAAFFAQITGMPLDWLLENCTTGDSQMTGTGLTQAYSHSCGATTVQTIRGEYDPIYALKLHTENADVNTVDRDDPLKGHQKMADEQRTMLESTYKGSTDAAHRGTAATVNDSARRTRWWRCTGTGWPWRWGT